MVRGFTSPAGIYFNPCLRDFLTFHHDWADKLLSMEVENWLVKVAVRTEAAPISTSSKTALSVKTELTTK